MSRATYHHGDLKNALIRAAIEIVATEGVYGLTLRKAARRVGVSHNAPYAHFPDKQALIAAIVLDGHNKIQAQMNAVVTKYPNHPLRQLANLAWAYVQFGLESPAHYKMTFSGLLENEKNYPAFVEISHNNLSLISQIVADCQVAGVLIASEANSDGIGLTAVSAWGLIHGLVSLMIEGQVPSRLMEQNSPQSILLVALQQMVRVPIDENIFNG
jgi:AcrR family transcriptional regulator